MQLKLYFRISKINFDYELVLRDSKNTIDLHMASVDDDIKRMAINKHEKLIYRYIHVKISWNLETT